MQPVLTAPCEPSPDAGWPAVGQQAALMGSLLWFPAARAPRLTSPPNLPPRPRADAIAVQKGNDVLRRRLSAALVEQMQAGAASWGWRVRAAVRASPAAPSRPRPVCSRRRRLAVARPHRPQSGAASPVLRWEQGWLADNGVLSNPELSDVVEAISYFRGGSSAPAEGGARG